MKQTIFILMFMWAGIVSAQIGGNPTNFNYGTKYPNATHEGDTISTATKIPIFNGSNTLNSYANLGDLGALAGVPRDSLIVQSPSSLGNIYHYWKGTEAQQDSILGLDPNFFDDMLWICTDCPQQGGGGTADQFVMGDSSFKDFIDDDTFASATSTNIPSAESVKAYVDNNTVTVTSGTFTPTLSSTGGGAVYTPSTNNSAYLLIGDLVYFYVDLSGITNTGSPTGTFSINISSIPYTPDTGAEVYIGRITGSAVTMDGVSFVRSSEVINVFLEGTLTFKNPGSFTSGRVIVSGFYIKQ